MRVKDQVLIDPQPRPDYYLLCYCKYIIKTMESSGTEQLEQQLDSLIQRYQELRDENRKLRTSKDELEGERSKLLDKNELATAKIEAMINRLKSMESPK
jgi:cell division protein ZapB